MTGAVSIALAGIGKIARDQHVPALRDNPNFFLAATVSRSQTIDDVPAFQSLADMARACPGVTAVSICTPPRGRLDLVMEALQLGLNIMIEKPPAATLSEAEALVAAAGATGRSLFVTWHSREAAAVEPAQAWIASRDIDRVEVSWKENVRQWHPGQEWIWEPGIGVFDPGINALSVLTKLFPNQLLLERADLSFPANRDAPIAASLKLSGQYGLLADIEFDFDQLGEQTWEITIAAGSETMRLTEGATRMFVDDVEQETSREGEYPKLYRRFADLLKNGSSDTDLAPFRLVADAFVLGRRHTIKEFDWGA
jgi:D-galactose 1-dehydrogenase